jgi:hypothetical protein
MAPWKIAKVVGESMNPNTNFLSYTSLRVVYTMKTWTQVFDILQYDLINCPDDSGDKVTETHVMKLRDIA